MKEVKLENLQPMDQLPAALYHPPGTMILNRGEALTAEIIDVMKGLNVESLVFAESGENPAIMRRNLSYTVVPIEELSPGEKLPRPIHDENGQLLLEANNAVPASLAESLGRRGIKEVFLHRADIEQAARKAHALKMKIEQIGATPSAPAEPEKKTESPRIDRAVVGEVEAIKLEEAPEDSFVVSRLKASINRMAKIEVETEGQPFSQQLAERTIEPASAETKSEFSSVINDSLDTMRDTFDLLRSPGGERRSINLDGLNFIAAEAMGGLVCNRELLMLCTSAPNQQEYLVRHAVATAVYSINIATELGLDTAQIKSLVYGALLADVGMLKVSKEILDKKGELDARQHAEIRKHSADGLEILQRVKGLPVEVPYIVYQVHERSDNSGYPCGKSDLVIHPFAKIVSVADIYTAASSDRPYRPAHSPYEAMEQLVMMCGRRKLNSATVHGMLKCNALFPVASFVWLSDGRYGRVISPGTDYMKPVVRVLWDDNQCLLAEPETIALQENEEITIMMALGEDAIPSYDDPLIGF